MSALRWILLISAWALVGGWALLLVASEKFRSSFGASSIGPLVALAPFPVMALVLFSLRVGSGRTLLHITAAAVAVSIALILWSAEGKTDPSVLVPLSYLGLWLVYYALTIRV